jgi:uncharacterized membrane protein YqaE (UPF0057 family)
MNMKKLSVFVILAAGVLISSCTSEHSLVKRHYNKGYYVDHIASVEKSRPVETASAPTVVSKPVSEQVLRTESEESMQASKATAPAAPVVATASAACKHAPVAEAKEENRVVSNVSDKTTGLAIAKESAHKEVNLDAKETRNRGGDDANTALLVILCIFIPFLAVFIKEKSITVNFWIDLLLCFLFYLPGIIFAFYVCFFK